MEVREFASGDGQSVRRLWDDLGGWYRNTSPASNGDVDRAIGQLLRQALTGHGPRRGNPAEGGWVATSHGSITGWLYARADPEQNYIVPLVPPEDTTGAFAALLGPAREWFRNQEARRFVVDIPDGRPDLRAVAQPAGRVLWHRAVFDRDLNPLPTVSAVRAAVREFSRGTSHRRSPSSVGGTRRPRRLRFPSPSSNCAGAGSGTRRGTCNERFGLPGRARTFSE